MADTFFQVIKKEHQGHKKILGQLDKTTVNAPKKREQLFEKLRMELVPHVKAEDNSLYQLLLAKKKARDVALEAMEEHHVVEMVLEELWNLSKAGERWGAKLAVLKEIVEHHIEEEETRVFKSTRESLNKSEIQAIGELFAREKQRIKQKLM